MEIAQTADHALRVLDCIAAHGHRTIAQLIEDLGLSRSAAQRVLASLHRRALVTKAPQGGYVLGPALIRLAQHLPHPLAAAGAAEINRLGRRTGETVVLAVPSGDEAVVVASNPGRTRQLRVEYEAGFRHELASGASGIAILAFLAAENHGVPMGPELETRLDQVRRAGIARTEGQLRDHMIGLAAPILHGDQVLGSIAIIAPSLRAETIETYTDDLRAAAAGIARAWSTTHPADAEEPRA